MHEITLYTCGDSRDISTWSNVPYLFALSLEKKGYVLHRIDISPSRTINHVFNSLCFLIFKRLLHRKACPEFHRTWLHRRIIYHRLKRASKVFPHSELNLFLSFAFTNIYSNKPSVLWCDWTDRIVIERLGRQPQWFEKRSLHHEDKVMKRADAVYTMFPQCQKQMEKLYGREITYLHRNVINTVYDGSFHIEETITKRQQSNKILFIGNIRYISGALLLIKTIQRLRKSKPDLELHIIGMTHSQIPAHENVYCHGYLHKDIEKERNEYYNLLLNCRCIVNPTKGWAGYSSCVEAMYYGCPVIVSPFDDFTEEFGTEIDFGYYCDENNLEQKIAMMLEAPNYADMCRNAHERVKDYTWDKYIDAFILSLKEKGIIQE